MHDVIGQTRGQRVARGAVAVCALAIPYLYVSWINHSSQAFSDATKAWLIATAAIVTGSFLAFAYHFLIEGPFQLWKDQQEKLHPNAEYDAEWERLNAVDRRPDPPIIEALKRDWTDRTAASIARAREPKRDTHLSEALGYAAFGEWGRDFSEAFVAAFEGNASDPAGQFRQLARDSKITVWGKLRTNQVYDKIPADHWAKHGIDEKALLDGKSATRWTDIHGSDGEEYHDLMVDKRDIEREWRNA